MTGRRSIAAFARLAALALVLGTAALAAGPAAAAMPGEVTAFDIGACSSFYSGGLAPAAKEGVLVRTCANPRVSGSSTLVNLLPSGALVPYALPTSAPGPMVAGSAGEIWSVGRREEGPAAQEAEISIDRIAPDGSVATFPLGSPKEPSNGLEAYGLVADAQGGAWVAIGELGISWNGNLYNSTGGELVHLTADGVAARFPVPDQVEPQGLAGGPDGNLWFTGVRGRYSNEHSGSEGEGFLGRMTPTGEFALFPVPAKEPKVGGIAVAPDGLLWFTEPGAPRYGQPQQLGTIGVDGAFGPLARLRLRPPGGALTIGPEGDVWAAAGEGVVRLNGWGQETYYPQEQKGYAVNAVVTGPEGDIWALHESKVYRVVPGGTGVEIRTIAADPKARTVSVTLACGGSASVGCTGVLELALQVPRVLPPRGVKQKPPVRIARAAYSVPAEATATRTIAVGSKAFSLARRYRPLRHGHPAAPTVLARATVAAGPTATRRRVVPSLVSGQDRPQVP